ncbi:MAG: phage shock protein A [Flavobacteriales bacterium]|jgi:phage shock protein A
MNVWAKMLTALRGGVNEAGEAIVGGQALRILDQEVREASEELRLSKDSLAAILARQKLAEEKVSKLQISQAEYEGYAEKALEQGEEALALEVAQKIADIEAQVASEQTSARDFSVSVKELRAAISVAEQNIKRLKQQVDTVKATENVQRAQMAVAERHSGSDSKMRTAMDSLERIKERQALKSAQMSAAAELSDDLAENSLQDKLEAAGIGQQDNNAAAVLARIKNKNK